MKTKYSFLAFFVMFILALFNGGDLYAQEAVDPLEAEVGSFIIVPSDDELAALLSAAPNPNAVVGPLVQKKWNQYFPYNNLFPVVNGQRLPTNCGTTAIAQIMAFHRHPARGNGQSTGIRPPIMTVPSVNFNVAYDWDNMLNSYRTDGRDSNERQRNAVAALMYHIAAARGANSSIAMALTTNFGYDKSIQMHYYRFYTDSEWAAMIKAQLDAGLPVHYRTSTEGDGHNCVVDGYDNTGRFHINWGWSGRYDGWYNLHASMQPANFNFKPNPSMYINIKPDAGGVSSYEMGLEAITASKTSILQYELLTVTFRLRSFSSFPGGQAGAALVDTNGRIAAIIGSRNIQALSPGSGWTSNSLEVSGFIPDIVRPGQYRLMIVTRPNGGNWNIATKSAVRNGVSNAINVTVTADVANGGGHGLVLESFTADKVTVSQNEKFTVQATIRNRRADAFPGGQIGAALVDNNGNIAEVIGSSNIGAFDPGYRYNNRTVNCTVPNTIRPGRYRLRIVIRPTGGEWKIATIAIDSIPTFIEFTVR